MPQFQIAARRVLIVSVLLQLAVCGCSKNKLNEDQQGIVDSLREIAPETGTGTTSYNYATGETLQQIEWSNFSVVSVRWYDKDGKLVWETPVVGNRCLAVDLDQDGRIKSVYEAFGLAKSGSSIVFEPPAVGHLMKNSL